MAQLIDRRPNAKGKSTVNRQRFLRRYKKQIKEAISDQISKRSVTDVDGGESVSIPTRDISEPTLRSDRGGVHDGVYPGNKEFAEGDRIQRPSGGAGGQGRRASDSGEGEVTVRFIGELTSAVKNADGEIIEGDPNEIKRQRDVWTFARTMGADDPNWQLVATGE